LSPYQIEIVIKFAPYPCCDFLLNLPLIQSEKLTKLREWNNVVLAKAETET